MGISPYWSSRRQRAFDVSVSAPSVLFGMPIEYGFSRYLERYLDPGERYFRQDRDLGEIVKLRTMYNIQRPETDGARRRHDSRVPRQALLVRKAKIDELPQLRPVLLGKVSIVGLRDMDSSFHALVREHLGYRVWADWDDLRRNSGIRRGLMNRAQVLNFNANVEDLAYVNNVVEGDYEMAENASLLMDVGVVFDTMRLIGGSLLSYIGAGEVTPQEAGEATAG